MIIQYYYQSQAYKGVTIPLPAKNPENLISAKDKAISVPSLEN